jgi:pimeloyl-ACP methyl ester carboxylesterase
LTIKTLILLPGLDGTGTLYSDLISELPSTLCIKIIDYPRQRSLSYSQLAAWLEDAVPVTDPFVVVAESFSTPLAAIFAAARPNNLQGMVLCAGFVTNPVGAFQLLVKVLTVPLLFCLRPPNFLLDYFLIGSEPPTALRKRIRRALRLVRPSVLAGRVRAAVNCDVRDELRRTEVPLMYIHAENDHLIQRECFSEIQRVRPDVVLASIPGPHLVFQREPRKAAEAIIQFLNQLATGPA